jgi:hypothetical protein
VDVHPPHRSISTWKDFLLHLLTITIGLFIALTLEAAVQSMHHRHLVRDARETLRREIEANHRLYADNARNLGLNRNRLEHDIEQLRELRNGRKLDSPDLSWGWRWSSYQEAAWKSAQAIGAVSYMDPDKIAGYSLVYGQQEYINATAIAIINEESRAGAPLEVAKEPAKLTPSEIELLLIKSAEIDQSLGSLQSTMQSLDDTYVQALRAL